MSKRTRKRRKLSTSQTIFWIMSGLLAATMVISLIIVAVPQSPTPTPTPVPTWTSAPLPTATPSPVPPEPSPTSPPPPSPTVEATATQIGPQPATATPTLSPSFTPTPAPTFTTTPTPTLTATPAFTQTPSSGSPAFTFAVCGDSQGGAHIYQKVLTSVMADGSGFLINTGDLVHESTTDEWDAFQQAMAGFNLPFYPVPGNHDGVGDTTLEGYLRYSGASAAHYSFDRGLVHFTMADSHNGGIGAGELAWLRDDLSATSQPVKIVVLHHPPFDPDGTDHIMAYGNEQFMALMAEQKVDYVLTGHIHAYVRGERDGVAYVITGGATRTLYSGHPQAFHHYLRVTVRGEKVAIEPIRI